MKHWTLFTIRLIARVGLAATIITWICTRSVKFEFGFQTASVSVAAGAVHDGWGAVCSLGPTGETWWFNITDVVDTEFESQDLNSWWPLYHDTGIGIQYRQLSVSSGHMLLFSYPLLCGAFLLATVATSWKRQKPYPPISAQAEARES